MPEGMRRDRRWAGMRLRPVTPQPNQRWNGPIGGKRKYRLPPKDPKPCPRCYAPCRFTDIAVANRDVFT